MIPPSRCTRSSACCGTHLISCPRAIILRILVSPLAGSHPDACSRIAKRTPLGASSADSVDVCRSHSYASLSLSLCASSAPIFMVVITQLVVLDLQQGGHSVIGHEPSGKRGASILSHEPASRDRRGQRSRRHAGSTASRTLRRDARPQ
jgi:hypothetical protein